MTESVRLLFAKTFIEKPQSFWDNVLLKDETEVELFGNVVHQLVYRERALKEKNTLPRVKHGEVSTRL